MFYKVSQKNLLLIRNSILQRAIPTLEGNGFERAPFTGALFGRNNLGDFTYKFARLSNSHLEIITIHICRGDKWIQVELNIFELSPVPKKLSELRKIDGIAFWLPPDSQTAVRIDLDLYERNFIQEIINFVFSKNEYRIKSFCTHSGFVRRQSELEELLKRDFKNIDLIIEKWLKKYTPLKTNWDGKPILK